MNMSSNLLLAMIMVLKLIFLYNLFFVLDLKLRWEKEPVVYHYRRFAVSKFACSKSNITSTYSLSPGRHPLRVFLAVVEAKKAAGTQESSPFEFYRSWDYETATAFQNTPQQSSQQQQQQQQHDFQYKMMIDKMFENQQKLQQQLLQQQLELAQVKSSKGRGKGKGKGKSSQQEPELQGSFLGRMFSKDVDVDADEGASTSSRRTRGGTSIAGSDYSIIPDVQGDPIAGDPPAPTPNPDPSGGKTKKTIYIKQVKLMLEGKEFGKNRFSF
jgi:hypothetical protein